MKREHGKRFGDDAYAFEELVAEIGAAGLCAKLAITNAPRPDHAPHMKLAVVSHALPPETSGQAVVLDRVALGLGRLGGLLV